jgi:hypothetical protein
MKRIVVAVWKLEEERKKEGALLFTLFLFIIFVL